MFKYAVAGTLVVLLTGCANPLGGGDVPQTTSDIVDPLEDVDLLRDVNVGDAATVALAETPPPNVGALFGALFSGAAAPAGDAVVTNAAAGTSASSGTGGLFGLTGRANATRTGPDAQVIPFGTQLAFGEIATVCDAPSNALGTRVAAASGFEVFDSAPNSTALRPHYITGFPDGCMRQVSAALVLLGDVGTHELVRYSSANRGQSFSATDSAYEAIKASYCRVGHGQPCGGKIDALSDTTTFLTVYQNFGANNTWAEVLLSNGAVTAMGMESF